jgi:hypothetical protein
MQRYNNLYFTFNALHVSGGFSVHHQELKNCRHSIGYCQVFLLTDGKPPENADY